MRATASGKRLAPRMHFIVVTPWHANGRSGPAPACRVQWLFCHSAGIPAGRYEADKEKLQEDETEPRASVRGPWTRSAPRFYLPRPHVPPRTATHGSRDLAVAAGIPAGLFWGHGPQHNARG
jgi:hypothetical protein